MLVTLRFFSCRWRDIEPMGNYVSGVIAVLQTPFTENGALDEPSLANQIDWVYENGVNGVAIGMVSEVLRLSDDERADLGEMVCRLNAGRGSVVLSVGAESTEVAAWHAARAASAGASAVMAIPPLSVTPGESELLSYYERIVKEAAVPLIVQDASGYVGRGMSVEFQVAIWREFGESVMFKPEGDPVPQRVSQLREATNGGAKVLEGSGGLHLVDTFERGVVGTMPAADLCWAIVEMWNALIQGSRRRATSIGGSLALLIAMQHSLDSYVAFEKYFLVKQGIITHGTMRGPVDFTLDVESTKEADFLFEELSKSAGRATGAP